MFGSIANDELMIEVRVLIKKRALNEFTGIESMDSVASRNAGVCMNLERESSSINMLDSIVSDVS